MANYLKLGSWARALQLLSLCACLLLVVVAPANGAHLVPVLSIACERTCFNIASARNVYPYYERRAFACLVIVTPRTVTCSGARTRPSAATRMQASHVRTCMLCSIRCGRDHPTIHAPDSCTHTLIHAHDDPGMQTQDSSYYYGSSASDLARRGSHGEGATYYTCEAASSTMSCTKNNNGVTGGPWTVTLKFTIKGQDPSVIYSWASCCADPRCLGVSCGAVSSSAPCHCDSATKCEDMQYDSIVLSVAAGATGVTVQMHDGKFTGYVVLSCVSAFRACGVVRARVSLAYTRPFSARTSSVLGYMNERTAPARAHTLQNPHAARKHPRLAHTTVTLAHQCVPSALWTVASLAYTAHTYQTTA